MNDEERNFKCWFAVQYHQQPAERQAAWRQLYPAMFQDAERRALLDELDAARVEWLNQEEHGINVTPRELMNYHIRGYHDNTAALQRYINAVRALDTWDNGKN
jgi:hypothetical protein